MLLCNTVTPITANALLGDSGEESRENIKNLPARMLHLKLLSM